MKSKNGLKETDIKNRVCYYFDDIINGTKNNFSNILSHKKLYENILVYNILHKAPTDPKPLSISFDKIDGFIVSLNGKIKYLILSLPYFCRIFAVPSYHGQLQAINK